MGGDELRRGVKRKPSGSAPQSCWKKRRTNGDPPVSGTVLRVIYLLGFIVSSLIRAPYARHPHRERIAQNRVTALDKLLIFLASMGTVLVPLLFLITPWLDFADYQLPLWAGWLGALILAGSLWLFWRSHAELGQNWFLSLQTREGHVLVTEGVFRHIRHPMYASMWLWGIAQALVLQNWIAGLSGLAGLLPVYLLRVPREERMMVDHFGEAYISYMSRTGRVLPPIFRLRKGGSAGKSSGAAPDRKPEPGSGKGKSMDTGRK
jgi:protein-S-isoprenylcysteine O-methyltransferase Ste14